MSYLILMRFGVIELFPSARRKLRGRRSTAGKTPGLGGGVTTARWRCGTGVNFAPTLLASQAAR